MGNNSYLGRGIHNLKFLESLRTGNLTQMLTVINNDKDLDIQIRNDYLNIYYKGGNICKVNSEKRIEFDMFYFYLEMKNSPTKAIKKDPTAVMALKTQRDLLVSKFEKRDYLGYFAEAKVVMDKWFLINPKLERMEQHNLSVENQFKKSDYTIIDLEYQVSTESAFACTFSPRGKDKPKKPRFDIIAINKQGKLCVIELKKGVGALGNTSGLKEHWDCFRCSIGSNHSPFMKEMSNILEQKISLNLIDNQVRINYPVPEFVFAYVYDDKTTVEEQDRRFNEEYNKIGESIPVIKLKGGSYKLLDA